ncbi:MADF DNA bdg and/or BESS domain containing protein [Asbolus verrucosus]|uniref:MADF DNA bdg and/or BESS domain containing protein n=1 Tax=Asbolus verrucosus TaxID=1661398 RepID=A0A482VCS7_ASBVE|nr:MADF DNA bdg and/or BESS domain containing protein [Asbolus verrucosus]
MDSSKTEKLIRLVSSYPQLYDGKHKEYGDSHKRELIWQWIGQEIGIKGIPDVCKSKWNILRGGYRRALRNKESGVIYRGKKWRFEDDLSFLKNSVVERRKFLMREKKKNVENISDNDEEITLIKEEPTEITYEKLSDNQDEEWTNSSEKEMIKSGQQIDHDMEKDGGNNIDSIKRLFLSLAETVKTLPPLVQAQVKAEVFQCVSSAEIKYLRDKDTV